MNDMTDSQQWYQRYLQTDHWRELRLCKLEEIGNRCEKCKRKSRLHVHHLKYTPYGERLADLQVLCEECHEHVHGLEREAKFEKLPDPPVVPIAVRGPKVGKHKKHKHTLQELHYLFTSYQFDGPEQLREHLRKIPRKLMNRYMNDNAGTPFAKELWTFLRMKPADL